MEYEKLIHSGIKRGDYLKRTSSEGVESGVDVGKPGMEEHLTFGMFEDSAKCWHIPSGN